MDQVEYLRDALRLIDRYGCTNEVGGRCSDQGSGRTRGAEYSAEAWCDACIAAAALPVVDALEACGENSR